MTEGLELIVRTPHEDVVHATFDAVRVPTETGQVGIRPSAEPCVLAVEPGLVVARRAGRTTQVGTAGGLLHVERRYIVLLSAFAVVGDDAATILRALDVLTATASAEMELRRRIESLERGLVAESRRRRSRDREPTVVR